MSAVEKGDGRPPGRNASPTLSPTPVPLTPLEEAVARTLRPRGEELAALAKAREGLVAAAQAEAARRGLPLKRALVAGSAARETYLPIEAGGRLDMDLFMLFDPSIPREQLARQGLELAGALLQSPEKRYAEHPYLRGTYAGFAVDAVPGYQVERSDRPQTAVDRTPFHHAFLSPRLTPELRDHIRLLKRFLKTLGIYGADARTEGCSGYLVELLIVRYGSLGACLRDARGWRIPQRLCPPGPEPSVSEEVALVLPDPVDAHRNVASALSRRNLGLLITAAQVYGEKPRREFFLPPKVPVPSEEELRSQLKARGTEVVALRFSSPDLVDDIIYPQLRKCERALAAPLERWGYQVLGTASARVDREAAIVVEIDRRELGPTMPHPGPPVGAREAANFYAKWGRPSEARVAGPYVTPEGRLQVDVRRATRDAVKLLQRELPNLGFGKSLQKAVVQGADLAYWPEAPSSPALLEALRALWTKGFPWDGWPPAVP
ncbi:MAG: CCA tRNA nucleotidyltransferase [Euryarchaeota archaeon]|nr:CCA tRNA nucleotidyltransferase [Euryarchaeota archaeon]